MMDIILKRRSTRKFTSRKVEDAVIAKIVEATMTAPSSKNVRSTRIAYSDKPEVAAAVASMRSTGTAFVAEAPLVFFVMGDASTTDLWKINAAISATILQLAVESMGLGSCWVHVDGRPHDEADPTGMTAQQWLREQIPTLPGYEILCAIAVGYPLRDARPHTATDDSDKIFRL